MRGFNQFFDVGLPAPGWQVYGTGGSAAAGYYKVDDAHIVVPYNRCKHQRSDEELALMDDLHEAYRAGRKEEALQYLAQARAIFPPCSRRALNEYAKVLGAPSIEAE